MPAPSILPFVGNCICADGGFAPEDKTHKRLAELSQACHKRVVGLALEGKAIGRLRGQVRQALKTELDEVDRLVKQVLFAS